MEPDEAAEILTIRAQASFVGYNLEFNLPRVFLALKHPVLPPLLRLIKATRLEDGWTTFHTLAEHHGGNMRRLLEAIEPAKAVEILRIVNDASDNRKELRAVFGRSTRRSWRIFAVRDQLSDRR